ncbi:hypothetical protein EAH89_28215 [Roseomonas nepalensis]|uniref:Uncharacterized protein n=1 Tax=Muricoccus nepalensis TaxID=1854500 RepID=A0A502EY26_9PROT|nr:hypothetical protein [Roseomonas nepalensis]TPG41934.1 hypothetical protein EAH89_28215 [Roseomonas nepalensis]
MILTPALRARIEALAAFLVDLLDAADAPHADIEPDTDGELEPDEASTQPATLCPDRARVRTYRPSARQQCAACRRNGDPIPANLRRFGGVFGGVRA